MDLYEDEIQIAYTDETLKRNVIIEFYGVSTPYKDSLEEEIGVFASFKQDEVVYSYVLFISDGVLGPLPLFRIIADAIEYIEKCDLVR